MNANNPYIQMTKGAIHWAPVGSTIPTPKVAPIKPPAVVNEFAGMPFDMALGEVYGLRVWKMDDYGRLRARNWDKAPAWRPGVNEAKCLADNGDVQGIVDPTGRGRKVRNVTVNYSLSGTSQYELEWSDGSTETTRDVQFAPQTHAVPDENCTCGFYAYTESKHEEVGTRSQSNGGWIGVSVGIPRTTHFVLGVIRGTGRTLIGTKGFRCEKAEIVALRDPSRGGTKKASWRLEQAEKLRKVYPDVPLLDSRAALLDFAPIEPQLPEPNTEDFWALP